MTVVVVEVLAVIFLTFSANLFCWSRMGSPSHGRGHAGSRSQ